MLSNAKGGLYFASESITWLNMKLTTCITLLYLATLPSMADAAYHGTDKVGDDFAFTTVASSTMALDTMLGDVYALPPARQISPITIVSSGSST